MLGVHRMLANLSYGSRAIEGSKESSHDSITEASASEASGSRVEAEPLAPNFEAPSAPVLPWMRDMTSTGTRPSRASSVVSTRTKFSTTTFDDARSIDIHVGGQYFRIARDGSRITDEAPPPYADLIGTQPRSMNPDSTLSPNESRPSTSRRASVPVAGTMGFRGGRSRGTGIFDAFFGESDEEEVDNVTPRSLSPAISRQTAFRANILDPTEVDMPSPVDNTTSSISTEQSLSADDSGENAPGRNLSYKAGPENITLAPEARKLRTVSHNDLDLGSTGIASPLRRRNGVRLPTLITDTSDERLRYPGPASRLSRFRPGGVPGMTRSAGPVLTGSHDQDLPQSPTFIGRNAAGIFPKPPPKDYKQKGRDTSFLPRSIAEIPEHNVFANEDEPGSDEHWQPLPMDHENHISLHYAGLMRKLDRDHRKALHLKDKELEKLRERLNEVDIVYRQQLRARDFLIDDLKKRLENLEESTEASLEKARNQIEDLWESRWKDRDFHLRERMRRMEEDAQKRTDRIIAEQVTEERVESPRPTAIQDVNV